MILFKVRRTHGPRARTPHLLIEGCFYIIAILCQASFRLKWLKRAKTASKSPLHFKKYCLPPSLTLNISSLFRTKSCEVTGRSQRLSTISSMALKTETAKCMFAINCSLHLLPLVTNAVASSGQLNPLRNDALPREWALAAGVQAPYFFTGVNILRARDICKCFISKSWTVALQLQSH